MSVTDASSCIAVTSEPVSEPDAISIAFAVVDASCSGTCNGSISANVSGGVSPYSFLWSNGSTDSTISGLCGGTMNYLTVTDANGCVFVDSSSVSEPTTLALVVSSVDATCNNVCNGSASANISGGTSPYSYNWSNGDASANADSLCAGNYFVTASDANGCSAVDSASVSEPIAILFSVTEIDASCNGVCDGSVSVSATGGTSPYTYSGDGTNLCAGSYAVTVTDANGCIVSDSAAVSEPSAISVSVSSAEASCNGVCDGSVSVSASGGTSPYTYTGIGTNLCAGNYPVTVTDANGCNAFDSATVSEPAVLSISLNATPDSGSSNGTAAVIASGGTPPYNYLWTGGQTTAIATGLASGTYSVTVTDAIGCSVIDSVDVPLYIDVSQYSILNTPFTLIR